MSLTRRAALLGAAACALGPRFKVVPHADATYLLPSPALAQYVSAAEAMEFFQQAISRVHRVEGDCQLYYCTVPAAAIAKAAQDIIDGRYRWLN